MSPLFFIALMIVSLTGYSKCSKIISKKVKIPFMAASSIERAYHKPDDENFQRFLRGLKKNRADQLCAIFGCGESKAHETKLQECRDSFAAQVVCLDKEQTEWEIQTRYFKMKSPWKFAESDSKDHGNCMWNGSHCLGACSSFFGILTFLGYHGATVASAVFGMLAQWGTMSSRPIERSSPHIIEADEAFKRLLQSRTIEKVYETVSELGLNKHLIDPELRKPPRVPHEVFTKIACFEQGANTGYQNSPPPYETELTQLGD